MLKDISKFRESIELILGHKSRRICALVRADEEEIRISEERIAGIDGLVIKPEAAMAHGIAIVRNLRKRMMVPIIADFRLDQNDNVEMFCELFRQNRVDAFTTMGVHGEEFLKRSVACRLPVFAVVDVGHPLFQKKYNAESVLEFTGNAHAAGCAGIMLSSSRLEVIKKIEDSGEEGLILCHIDSRDDVGRGLSAGADYEIVLAKWLD